MKNDDLFAEYPDVVGVEELAKMLSIGRARALTLLQEGKIESFRKGRKYLIPKVLIKEYIFIKEEE